jgi:serine/threonine protein phosphatase 1
MSAGRTFVVGDVHGCVNEVGRLLESLAPSSADTICFLGDYVDRGPDARGTIERLIRLAAEGPRCVFLKGNHEDMFLAFLGLPGRYSEAFLENGGGATLASYGLSGCSGAQMVERLPVPHREFLLNLRVMVQLGDYLCVHAGLRPTRPLAAQDEEDLLWIRGDFSAVPHPFPFTVLYGHTPYREVFFDLPYKIGLDTGLVYGNRLSCFEIEQRRLWQIGRGEQRVTRRELADVFKHGAILA